MRDSMALASGSMGLSMLTRLREALQGLAKEKHAKHKRRVSVGDLLTDRWQNAREMGWGEGASCYDSVLVLGDVTVGKHTWVGPNVILDGSAPGGLVIGDFCSISAGVQIYTHHTVAWATSLGTAAVERKPTRIGSGVYIGPNSVIEMGVTIGDRVVIGAMSLVKSDIPTGARAWGAPALIQRTNLAGL
jgi:acetyltransferase-like isoleucine patch superfamily enzyme